jgi:hypothetical protein
LAHVAGQPGWAYWLLCACLLAGVAVARNPLRRNAALSGCAIALGYLLLASFSRNDQPRFLWCVWVAVPATLAALAGARPASPRARGWTLAALAAIVVLAASPMFTRFDFGNLRRAQAILRDLNAGAPMRIEIADDPPDFNNNTFQLARQLEWNAFRRIDVSATVYHHAEGKSLDFALSRLRTADYVLFLADASQGVGPDFTNQWRPVFLAFARACGQAVTLGEEAKGVSVFDMRRAAECDFKAP